MWGFLVSLGLVLSLRFVALPSHNQTIKSYSQIDRYFKTVTKYFKAVEGDIDSLLETTNKEIFMMLDDKKMASFLMVDRKTCYLLKERQAYPFLIFYYCTVVEEYRGKGLSYKIMKDGVDYLRRKYNLKDDTVMALHMSPFDSMMPVAAKMYYSLGFRRGMFIPHTPLQLSHKLDDIIASSRDMLEVAADEAAGVGDGYYFMVYCRLGDFGTGDPAPENTVELAQKLHETLKRRKEMEPNNHYGL